MSKFNINAQLRLIGPTNTAQVAAQIKNQLQGINVPINISIPAQAQRQLKNLNQTMSKTAKATKEAATGIVGFGESAALAAKRFLAFTIAGGAIVRFAGVVTEATKDAIDFERQMNRIAQATGSSAKAVGAISQEISRLGSTFGVSSKELAKASLILAQAGLSAKDTAKSLQALAKSDLAPTFDNIVDTTEGAIAVFNQFKVSAEQLEGVLGSINSVAAKFAVESGDIITAIRRTGGAFQAAGGDLNDLMALFTSVRQTTRESAESIATGFRTIFTRMQRVRTQSFLKTLGIDLQDIEGQFVGPYEAVRRLSIALKQLQGTDPRFAQIIEELGGFRQISKVIPLIQQFSVAERARGVAIAGTQSLTEDAARAQETLAVQIQKVKEQFATMIRTMVGSSTFKSMAVGALKLAEALIKIGNALTPILPLLATLATFKLGQSIIPFFKGFKAKGGLGFSQGGMVPGTGNRDTVPAMLTPGEFVLNKKATKRLGFAKGGKVPRVQYLAEGDDPATYISRFKNKDQYKDIKGRKSLKTFGAIVLNNGPDGRTLRGRVLKDSGVLQIPASADQPARLAKFEVRSLTAKASESFTGLIDKGLEKMVPLLGQRMAKIVGAKSEGWKGSIQKIPNYHSLVGGLFETAINTFGIPFSQQGDNNKVFDFPGGTGGRGGLFNMPPGVKPVDAKKTWDSKARANLAKKVQNWYKDNPQQIDKSVAAQKANVARFAKSPSSGIAFNLSAIQGLKSGDTITNKTFGSYGIKPAGWQKANELVEQINKAAGKPLLSAVEGKRGVSAGYIKVLAKGGLVPKAASSMMERNIGDIRRARRRRMTEEGKLDPQAAYLAKSRQKRFAQNMGSQKQRIVGYLDGDVLGNPAYAKTVQAEMAKAGVTGGIAGYHNYLIEMAGQKRKLGSLKKFSAIFGVPGSGKTSLAMKSSADKGTLRRTKRIPILRPSDIDKVDEVIETVASTSKALRELEPGGLFTGVDKFTILSSSTKAEQAEVIKRRKLRDKQIAAGTSKTGFGRKPGVTTGAEIDTGAVEALAMSTLGADKTRVLGIRPGFKLSRKKGEQIPELETKKIGLLYGALSPSTLGHAENAKLAAAAGIAKEDLIVAVSKVGGTAKAGDEHSQRTAIYAQGFRAALAKATFPGATVVKSGSQDFLGTAPTIFERQTGGGRRKFVKAGPGSIAFAGDDKGEKELEKYTKSGYGIMQGARSEISGTAARKAILEGNMEEMQKLLSPEAIKVIQANQGRIKNRAEVLPKLFARVETKVGKKAEDINQQLAQYPGTITGKIRTEQPEIAAKVEALRKQRDAVKRLREKMPVQMLNTLARMFPQKYGFLVQGFAKGGSVSDTVPAMLTPGEFVVNKKAVDQIGVSTLHKMNKGKVQGFAKGGSVLDKFGGVAGVGFAAAGISGLVNSFDGLNDTIKSVTTTLTAMATQGIVLHAAFMAVANFTRKYGKTIEDTTAQIDKVQGERKELTAKYKAGEAAIASKRQQKTVLENKKQVVTNTLTQNNQKISDLQTQRQFVQQQQNMNVAGATQRLADIDKEINLRQTRRTNALNRRQRIKAQIQPLAQDIQTDTLLNQGVLADRQVLSRKVQKQAQARKTAQRNQARASKFGGIAAVGGVVGMAAGAYFEDAGRAKLEAGTGGEGMFMGGKIAGGAGQGAAMGAAIGAVFGPVGIAVGALGGAAIGAAKAWMDAEKEIANIKVMREFNKALSQATVTMELFNKGYVSLDTARASMGAQATSIDKALSTRGLSKEARQDILAGAKNKLQDFNTVLDAAAKDTKTYEEFVAKAGPEVFAMTARLSDIPFDQFAAKWRVIIQKNAETAAAMDKAIAAHDAYAQSLQNILYVSSAFETVAMNMQRFDNELQTLISTSAGVAGGFKLLDESERLGSAGRLMDKGKFEEILNRDVTNNPFLQQKTSAMPDGIGASISQDIMKSQEIISRLPEILLNFRNNMEAFTSGSDAVDQLMKQFDQIEGLAPALRVALENVAMDLLGDEGQQSNLMDRVRKDLPGVLKEFEESLKASPELGQKISSAMTAEANRRTDFLSKLTDLTMKEIELRNQGLDIAAQTEELRARAANRPQDLDLLQGLDTQRQKNILGDDAGLANNVAGISLQLEKEKAELIEKQNALAKKGIDVDGKAQMAAEEQRARIQRLTSALEFMTKVTDRTSVTMQKIEKAQGKANFKQGIAEKVTFAETPQELRDLGNQVGATRTLAQTGDIDTVLPSLRQDVLELLDQLGDTKLGILGGKSGKEIKEQAMTTKLQKLGIAADEAKSIATARSPELEALDKILNQQAEDAKAANERLEAINDTLQSDVMTAYEKSVIAFNTDLGSFIKSSLVKPKEAELLAEQTKQQDVAKKIKAQDDLSGYGSRERIKNIADHEATIKQYAKDKEKELKEQDFIAQIDKQKKDKVLGYDVEDYGIGSRRSMLGSVFDMMGEKRGDDRRLVGGMADRTSFSEEVFFDKLREMQDKVTEMSGDTTGDTANRFAELVKTNEKYASFKPGKDGSSSIGLVATAELFSDALMQLQQEMKNRGGKGAAEQELTRSGLIGGTDALSWAEISAIADEQNKELSNQLKVVRETTESYDALVKANGLLTTSISNLAAEIDRIKTGAPPPAAPAEPGKHAGGWIYGHGIRDTVRARLTPGEFVLSRAMVRNIGKENVAQLAGGGLIDMLSGMANTWFSDVSNPNRALARQRRKATKAARMKAMGRLTYDERMARRPDRSGLRTLDPSKMAKTVKSDYEKFLAQRNLTDQVLDVKDPKAFAAYRRKAQAERLRDSKAKVEQWRKDNKIKPKVAFDSIKFRDEQAQLAEEREQRWRKRHSGTIAAAGLGKDLPITRSATGSLVPGVGSGDKVPALLEPGEFVLNRNAVGAIGAGRLSKFNRKFSRFQNGGSVRMQNGGGVAGLDMSAMDRAVQNFGGYVDKFETVANSMKGLEIQLRATHQVEVIINGAQVLQGLTESMQNLVVSETNKAINSMLSQKFGLPPVDTAIA